jgi:hypothetical protein
MCRQENLNPHPKYITLESSATIPVESQSFRSKFVLLTGRRHSKENSGWKRDTVQNLLRGDRESEGAEGLVALGEKCRCCAIELGLLCTVDRPEAHC